MAALDFDSIFTAFYSLFRADSDIPTSSDDEYTVGMRLANEAIVYWAQYDNTYWRQLYTTNQLDGTGVQTVTTGTTTYTAPTNFKEAGGFVRVTDSNGNDLQRYPILEPHEVQFKDPGGTWAYFLGNPADGYSLVVNPAPTTALNGKNLDYVYYKNPTLFEEGESQTEMADPYFIVHRMLAMQFRAARNPYYTSALKDSENNIRIQQLHNNSGTWANPISMGDTSGSTWGS